MRDGEGRVDRIVEARDADAAMRAVAEVNAGVYAFRTEPVRRALAGLTTDNVQGEYYLTDVVADLRRWQLAVEAVRLADPEEMQGVNTRADLARVASVLNRRGVERLMRDGVTVVDPEAVWVDAGCHVERDAVLEPGVVLRGGARVGAGATVGAHSVIDGAQIAPAEVVAPLSHRS
jgi:bifunctional UDP-N-acetylglucosamine pyrophosphorylase/glucosamine-1-phosphate N-acetyltransferase